MDPAVETPEALVQDFEVSEPRALRGEADVRALLLEPLARADVRSAARALAPGFRGRALRLQAAGTSAELELFDVRPDPEREAYDDAAAFLEHLVGLGPLGGVPERVETEFIAFDLDASDVGRAAATARLRWAGPGAEPGARVDVTLFARLGLVESERGEWTVQRFDAVEPTALRPHGAGFSVRAPRARFVDRTAAVGATYGTSDEVVGMLQRFVDMHRTLSLGGVTVLDWNGDDRPDVLATREEHDAVLLLNDGRSGFVPAPLPWSGTDAAPAHAVWIDLDGDGREEIVGATAADYEGGLAYAPLWTRSGTPDGSWRELSRAFAMPNAVGLRRLAVQTASPIDFDGDGDLDLFFAVYGDAHSRGEAYNALLSFDGGDNHFFRNDGGLTFTEVSDAVGIEGTGYSFIALAFDADRDGDPDLFEGNDFGPNVLWRNEGGRFVADRALGLGGVSTYTMGATLADLEARGRWDLYVSNMSSEEGMRLLPHFPHLDAETAERVDVIANGNTLYTEGAPGERWTERARLLGVNECEWAWGCHWLDGAGDGALDLWVTNGFASHSDPTRGDWQSLYWRQVLDDGLALMEGRKTRDVNADKPFLGSFNGYERDRYFVRASEGNDPERVWYDAGYAVGLDADHDGRASAPLDADGDGDLDLIVQTVTGFAYYENTSPPTDALRLRLVEADGRTPALGATVMVEARGQRVARHLALVEGFQSQLLPDVHVGLGAPTGAPAERVTVRWADGSEEVLEGVAVGAITVVSKGRGTVETRPVPRWSSPADEADLDWADDLARLARTPAALGNPGRALVVRVHTDGEGRPPLFDTAERAQAARVVDAYLRTGAPFERSLDPTRSALLEPELFADATATGEETTVVYTGQGRPIRVFRGSVSADEVFAWAERAVDEDPPRSLLIEHGRLALTEGRYRDAGNLLTRAAEAPGPLRAGDAPLFEGLGRAYAYLGRPDLSVGAYRRAVETDPDYALGHFNLGAALVEADRATEAVASFEEVRRIEGDTARALGALAEAASVAGDTDRALEAARALVAVDPSGAGSRVLLGNLAGRAGELDEARAAFERALELDPRSADARRGLDSVLVLERERR